MARWATVGGPCTLAWQGLLAITSCPGGRRLPRAAGGVHYHGWRAEPAARVHARCAAGSHPTALRLPIGFRHSPLMFSSINSMELSRCISSRVSMLRPGLPSLFLRCAIDHVTQRRLPSYVFPVTADCAQPSTDQHICHNRAVTLPSYTTRSGTWLSVAAGIGERAVCIRTRVAPAAASGVTQSVHCSRENAIAVALLVVMLCGAAVAWDAYEHRCAK